MTSAKRSKLLRAITPSITGKYVPILSNTCATSCDKEMVVVLAVEFAALYVMLFDGAPPRRSWKAAEAWSGSTSAMSFMYGLPIWPELSKSPKS